MCSSTDWPLPSRLSTIHYHQQQFETDATLTHVDLRKSPREARSRTLTFLSARVIAQGIMKCHFLIAIGLAATLVISSSSSFAAEEARFGSEQEAKAMLEKAVAALKADEAKASRCSTRARAASRTATSMSSARTP